MELPANKFSSFSSQQAACHTRYASGKLHHPALQLPWGEGLMKRGGVVHDHEVV